MVVCEGTWLEPLPSVGDLLGCLLQSLVDWSPVSDISEGLAHDFFELDIANADRARFCRLSVFVFDQLGQPLAVVTAQRFELGQILGRCSAVGRDDGGRFGGGQVSCRVEDANSGTSLRPPCSWMLD